MTQRVLPNPPPRNFPTDDVLGRLTPFNVVVGRSDEVEEYLTAHPDLGSALAGICAKIRDLFGPDVELALEVYNDPEFQDRYLALYVRQAKYEAGILVRIEAVASPFMTQLETSSGHLLVTTDFRPRG